MVVESQQEALVTGALDGREQEEKSQMKEVRVRKRKEKAKEYRDIQLKNNVALDAKLRVCMMARRFCIYFSSVITGNGRPVYG